jgi:hypothetical protein
MIGPDLVFNMDETCCQLSESPRKVLAENGTETIKLHSKSSEKTPFTALGAISAAGRELHFGCLQKGRIQRCERKPGANPDVVVHPTESGWATENIIIADIEWLHEQVAVSVCTLIIDAFPTHGTDRVLATAEADDVELFVPASARAAFDRRRWLADGDEIGHDESLAIFTRCWKCDPSRELTHNDERF